MTGAWPASVTLRDGSPILIRPIEPEDRDELAAGFERLSPESRYRRFFGPMKELRPRDLDHLTQVDHRDHEALIAFDPETGEGIGVGRFVRLDDGVSAEAAVTVVDDWQGRGLGTALSRLLADRARDEGIERFTALLLATNEQMHDVLASLGPAHVLSRDAGTVEVEVALPERGIGEHLAGVLRVVAGGTVELATPPWGLRAREG